MLWSWVLVYPVCLQCCLQVSRGIFIAGLRGEAGGSGRAHLHPPSPHCWHVLSGSRAAVRRVSGSPLQVNKLILALAFLKESLQHFSSFLLILMRRTFQEM